MHYDKVHGEDVSVCKLLAVLLWLLRQRVSKTRDQSQHSARYTLVVGQPQDEQTADTNLYRWPHVDPITDLGIRFLKGGCVWVGFRFPLHSPRFDQECCQCHSRKSDM